MRYPEFREMVATEYASIFTPYREIPLANTNELLFSYPPATGVKTGTTPAAGETLVSSAVVGDEAYVCVVLDAVRTALRPRSGHWSTASPRTIARISWSRGGDTPG
jgi:D-alanyl-D-alanine carboxypeptidase